jgi:hypothetical protein
VGGQGPTRATLPLRKTRYPFYRRLDGPQGRSGLVRKIWPQPGLDPQTIQPVASRYTAWPTTYKCTSYYGPVPGSSVWNSTLKTEAVNSSEMFSITTRLPGCITHTHEDHEMNLRRCDGIKTLINAADRIFTQQRGGPQLHTAARWPPTTHLIVIYLANPYKKHNTGGFGIFCPQFSIKYVCHES